MFTQYLSNHSLITHQIWWTHTRLNKREKFPYWFSCHKVEGKGSKGQTTIDIEIILYSHYVGKIGYLYGVESSVDCYVMRSKVKGWIDFEFTRSLKSVFSICWLERHLLVNNFLKLFQNWKGWGLGVGWGRGHI